MGVDRNELTTNQRLVLDLIREKPGLTTYRVGKVLRWSSGSVWFVVHALERKGLVRAVTEPRPRSHVGYALTWYPQEVQMESKNDPILDARELCREKGPQTRQELEDGLRALGWHESVADNAIDMALHGYLKWNRSLQKYEAIVWP